MIKKNSAIFKRPKTLRQIIPTVKNPIFASKLKFEYSKSLWLSKALSDMSLNIEINKAGIAIISNSNEYNNKLN